VGGGGWLADVIAADALAAWDVSWPLQRARCADPRSFTNCPAFSDIFYSLGGSSLVETESIFSTRNIQPDVTID